MRIFYDTNVILDLLANRPGFVDVAVSDYEDTVQYLNATVANADVIVTRDKDGFAGADIRVCTPREFLVNA